MAFEYLATYKTFESVSDMDIAVENHMAAHYYDLTESKRAIVFKFASHALEHPGACHLKAAQLLQHWRSAQRQYIELFQNWNR